MSQAYIFSIWTQTTFTDRKWSKNYQNLGKVDDFTPEEIDKLVNTDRKGYILEVDVEYPKEPHKDHNERLFFAEGIKIGKVEKLVTKLKVKSTYVVIISN